MYVVEIISVGGYRIVADDEEGFSIAFLNAASADSGFTAATLRIVPNAQEMVPRFNGLTEMFMVCQSLMVPYEVQELNGLTGEQHAVSKFNGVTEVHGVSKLNDQRNAVSVQWCHW